MGTRGAWGFVVDGDLKLAYNHYDSYPTGLGAQLLEFLKNQDLNELKRKAAELELIDESVPPTQEQIQKCIDAGTVDLSVSEQSYNDWYCLLRDAQGEPQTLLDLGLMSNSNEFVNGSLFCEWAYVIDLDQNNFEIYQGFQKTPHTLGRFSTNNLKRSSNYYPVRLVAVFSLTDLPLDFNDLEEFLYDESENADN